MDKESKPDKLSAHQLAAILLAGPDLPVAVLVIDGDREPEEVALTKELVNVAVFSKWLYAPTGINESQWILLGKD